MPWIDVDTEMVRRAHDRLVTAHTDRIDAVCLGTPHYSADELGRLASLLGQRSCAVPLYVNTGRDVLAGLETDVVRRLEVAGVRIVTDTCTYITPILDEDVAVVMTDSAKWAHYAPANLGVEVAFGSVAACVEAAVTGRVGDPW